MRRSRLFGSALFLILAAHPLASAAAGTVDDPVLLLDTLDRGPGVRLTELGPGPYVVVPIFTSCRAVCSRVAKILKSAWEDQGPDGSRARIVLVSFDPRDTREDMAHFRELFDLPRAWYLATMEREDGLSFFSSLGFQWRTLTRRQFDHSGKIFVLDDELRISAVLGPDQLSSERLSAETQAAASGGALARRIGTHWVGFFGVGVVLLSLVVAVTWEKARWTKQST